MKNNDREKELLKLYFEMLYHYKEYKRLLEQLKETEQKISSIQLNDVEKNIIKKYYVDKKKLKEISEEEDLSYGYIRHKISNIRKKLINELSEQL